MSTSGHAFTDQHHRQGQHHRPPRRLHDPAKEAPDLHAQTDAGPTTHPDHAEFDYQVDNYAGSPITTWTS
jgi:hypothetical protein